MPESEVPVRTLFLLLILAVMLLGLPEAARAGHCNAPPPVAFGGRAPQTVVLFEDNRRFGPPPVVLGSVPRQTTVIDFGRRGGFFRRRADLTVIEFGR
jgi:hypothetical protein